MCEIQNQKNPETLKFLDFIVSLFDKDELKILEMPVGKENYNFKEILLRAFSNQYLLFDFETCKFEVTQFKHQLKTEVEFPISLFRDYINEPDFIKKWYTRRELMKNTWFIKGMIQELQKWFTKQEPTI